MAKPISASFGGVVVTIDDGSGDNQVAPCGFTKKSVKLSAQSSDTVVPDCDDPNLPAFVERNVVSLSCEISGSGLMAMENSALWMLFFMSGASRACVVTFPGTGANGGFSISGSFILSDFPLDVDRKSEGGRAQQSITLQNDGAFVYAPAA